MKLESTSTTGLTKYKSDWRKKHYNAIHATCKKQGISDEKRKAYMRARWDKDSLTLLDDDELRECYVYAKGKSPSWTPSNSEQRGIQQLREKSLGLLLDELAEQAKAVNSFFDRNCISLKKEVILSMLVQRDKTLWIDNEKNPIAETTFNRFLTAAKICKFKSGRR